ncbi:MAG: PAS domain S-box protein [Cyanobacteria bacterium SBC]|nr:PAS domain S-box protein [Cyanobacteria bacterium SBC]
MSLQRENDELRQKVAALERQLQQLTEASIERDLPQPNDPETWQFGSDDSETLFRAYVETANDMVYTVDLEGRLTFINSYGQRLLRCSSDRWEGRSYLEFVAPSFRKRTAHAFEDLLATGELKDFEFQLQPLAGTPIDMEVNGRLLYRNGTLIGGLGIARDVTDRKRFEHQLQMFLKAIEAAHDSAAIVDFQGTIVYANSATARMFGYDVNALCGKPAELLYPDNPQISQAYLAQQALENPTTGWSGEVICQRRNGEYFHALLSVSPVPDENGCPNAISVICRDITQQKAILAELATKNLELERSSRLKSVFLANMSHELRTPLTSILGFSNLLLQELYGSLNEKQRLYLDRIYDSGEHLLKLIGDVLDLSKVEAGKIELNPTLVSIPQLCADAIALVSEQARSRQIQIQTDLDPTLKTFIADEVRLRQMLLNLLSNAIKFSELGGRVGLDVQYRDRQLHLSVWDNGIGIPEDQQALLFQPFQQLDNSLSRQHEGSGLGLALTRKLAELHGGTVTCQSQVNRGSRFTIVLPLQPSDTANPDRDNADSHRFESESPAPEKNLLLLIEDHDYNALLLKDILEFWGYEVKRTANGQEALDWLENHSPASILMDIHLPGIDGLEVTRRIKADPRWQNIPVIATTALAMVGDRERCLEAGCDDYLSKPIGCDRLARILTKYAAVSPSKASPTYQRTSPPRKDAP